MNGEERARQARARTTAYDLAEVAAGVRDFDEVAAAVEAYDDDETAALIVAQARLSSLLAGALARRMPDRSRADVLRMVRTEVEVVAARREIDDLADEFPFGDE